MAVLNIGSLNLDYVYRVPHFVRPGETLAASHRAVHAGGKGLNQSVALARAGAQVRHAGCVGADGGMLADLLKSEGVDVSMLAVHESEASGHTFIQVTEDGENGILYYPGTNGRVTVESILPALDACAEDDLVMLQNELPDTTGLINAALERRLRVVLNPSPMDAGLLKAPLDRLHALIVNETEARGLLGAEAEGVEARELMPLLEKHFSKVILILTLGSAGALGREPGEAAFFVPAVKVKALDTTGAGYTFAGYVAAALDAGERLEPAMRRAARASAISVTREGAAPSIPTRAEVEAFDA